MSAPPPVFVTPPLPEIIPLTVVLSGWLKTSVALFVMLPLTLFVNWRLGAILVALLAIFAAAMNYVIRKTQDNQGVSNEIYGNVTSLVTDVLGNLPAIQSFTRIEREARDMRAMAEAFLQYVKGDDDFQADLLRPD